MGAIRMISGFKAIVTKPDRVPYWPLGSLSPETEMYYGLQQWDAIWLYKLKRGLAEAQVARRESGWRDRARLLVDKLGEIDRSNLKRFRGSLQKSSGRMGCAAARDILAQRGDSLISDGRGLSKSGEFDVVSYNKELKILTFVEAKSRYNFFGPRPENVRPTLSAQVFTAPGSRKPRLGKGRMVPRLGLRRAQQGSVRYFEQIVAIDQNVQAWLGQNEWARRDLTNGEMKVQYLLVHADVNGGTRMWHFDLAGLSKANCWSAGQVSKAGKMDSCQTTSTQSSANTDSSPTQNPTKRDYTINRARMDNGQTIRNRGK